MKTFGETNIEWTDFGKDKRLHVIVATRGSAWMQLCCAFPEDYVDICPDGEEIPSPEAVVWKHDRAKINCDGCLAVLDGAIVERKAL